MQEVSAQELPPCHQAAAAEENTSGCDMCQTALEAWEEKAVPVEEIITEIPEPQLFSTLSSPTFIFVSKLPTSLYLSYSPPPQAALKAVTPNTKTIVLLS